MIARFVGVPCRGPEPRARWAAVAFALALAGVPGGSLSARGQGDCADPAGSSLEQAAQRVRQLEDAAAAEAVRPHADSATCFEAVVASLALDGWREARRLASAGGAPDQLGAVTELLGRLEALVRAGPPTALGVQSAAFAHAVVRAAVAAAQDERDEMQVYLAHARGLAESLAIGGIERTWPLGIDLAEAELWLEVDRFDDARAAFARAGSAGGGARAVVGLARALRRLGDEPGACEAYQRAGTMDLGAAARRELGDALERLACRYR